MGWWSKIKKALMIAEAVAPVLPIPAKAKAVIKTVGDKEREVETIIRQPAPTAGKPPSSTP